MAGVLQDPPKGWAAMLELLAVDGVSAPPAPARGGFFARLFMGSVGRARQSGEADFARLGLRTVRHAEQRASATSRIDDVVGPTIVEGERFGRAASVRIDAERCRTKVEAPVAELHVRSDDGRLLASERSAAAVREALRSLSADDRWNGAEAKGDAGGVTVFRHLDRGGRTQQGYLDDLWLAEGLATIAAAPPP